MRTAIRSTAPSNQIPFIVRNDGETHDIVLQTSDTTWHAYNGWGGNNGEVGANFYGDTSDSDQLGPDPGAGGFAQDRAYAVSYNRPFITRDGTGPAAGAQDYLFGADYAAIYWLEKNGYDVSYISGVDTDRLGADYLKNYKAFISVGHDEYWSGDQRANVEEARDAGVNLLFWSGNEVYWKTRWEVAISADGTAYRTLVCYKETLRPTPTPTPARRTTTTSTRPTIWTGTWLDTRFHGNPLAGGGNPEDVDPITGLNPAATAARTSSPASCSAPTAPASSAAPSTCRRTTAGLRVWRDTTVANGGTARHRAGHPRLRVGHLARRRYCVPPASSSCPRRRMPWDGILVDQGNTRQPGCRDAQPLALPHRERRAGLRRRHHLLELGAQRRA